MKKVEEWLKSHVFFVVIIVFGLTLTAPFIFTRQGSEYFDFTETGNIGDTIAGTTAPIIGLLSIVLLYLTFKAQREAMEKQKEASDEQIKIQQQALEEQQLALQHQKEVSEEQIRIQQEALKDQKKAFLYEKHRNKLIKHIEDIKNEIKGFEYINAPNTPIKGKMAIQKYLDDRKKNNYAGSLIRDNELYEGNINILMGLAQNFLTVYQEANSSFIVKIPKSKEFDDLFATYFTIKNAYGVNDIQNYCQEITQKITEENPNWDIRSWFIYHEFKEWEEAIKKYGSWNVNMIIFNFNLFTHYLTSQEIYEGTFDYDN